MVMLSSRSIAVLEPSVRFMPQARSWVADFIAQKRSEQNILNDFKQGSYSSKAYWLLAVQQDYKHEIYSAVHEAVLDWAYHISFDQY